MQVVYIDVLFILNLIIDYFILLAVSQILHRRDKRLRLLLGAFLGALYASLMFFPQLGLLYSAFLKLLFSAVLVLISFKCASVKNFLKLLVCFYLISTVFGGIIYAVELFLAPPGLNVRNGIMYMDISPLLLILTSAGCYIIIKLIARYFHRNVHTSDIYSVEISADGKSINLTALLDNGNDLCDVISGYPVIISEYCKVEKLIPNNLKMIFKNGKITDTSVFADTDWQKRVRMIPYGSVGNVGGMLPAFKPDSVRIPAVEINTSEVIVAVTSKRLSDNGDFSALLNPHLFYSGKKPVSNRTLREKVQH